MTGRELCAREAEEHSDEVSTDKIGLSNHFTTVPLTTFSTSAVMTYDSCARFELTFGEIDRRSVQICRRTSDVVQEFKSLSELATSSMSWREGNLMREVKSKWSYSW